jgi:hypothetical protein
VDSDARETEANAVRLNAVSSIANRPLAEPASSRDFKLAFCPSIPETHLSGIGSLFIVIAPLSFRVISIEFQRSQSSISKRWRPFVSHQIGFAQSSANKKQMSSCPLDILWVLLFFK